MGEIYEINGRPIRKFYVPTPPLEEIREQIKTGKDLNEIQRKFAKRYIDQYVKCWNEVFKFLYRKTVLNVCIEEAPFSITIYSEKELSELLVYAIASSYPRCYQVLKFVDKTELFGHLRSCYHGVEDVSNRIKLYEYVDDGLMIFLDVEPERLGFNPEVMKCTKSFNVKQENGKYKTIIKAYFDFDIVALSDSPLSLEDVVNIATSYRVAHSWVAEGESDASYHEFASVLEKKAFFRKILKYGYQHGFLAIELE